MSPKMIPNRYLADYKSGGEEFVFETLRTQAPDDWIVLHSLDIAPSDERRRGEADFIVIVPGLGAVVLEVKSVARQDADRQWHFGSGVVSSRSPFSQADAAMRSIMSFLEKAGVRRRPFFCSGVITPFGDITTETKSSKTIEWNEWQAIGRSTLASLGLVKALDRLITKEQESEAREPVEFDAGAIADLLRPRFEFYISPAARRERREEEIKRYTAEQFDVLDDFEANQRLLVMGPAGCGKTLLALELARRVVDKEQSVLLVCYNRALGNWIEDQVKPLGFLAVGSGLDSYMLTIAGGRPPQSAGSEFWDDDLPLTAAEKFRTACEPFDVLIVDEAQDLLSENRLLFLEQCLSGGLHAGRWVFFGDFENQDIQRREGQPTTPELLQQLLGTAVFSHRLRRNCRNTRSVARFAEEIAGLPKEYGYSSCLRPEEGESPRIVSLASKNGAEAALRDVLTQLSDDGYSNDEIVILSSCAPGVSAASRLAKEDRWRDVLRPAGDAPRGSIRYDSIRRFKGLEAPVVVLTDVDSGCASGSALSGDSANLLYVGATRSVDLLCVIADGETLAALGIPGVSP